MTGLAKLSTALVAAVLVLGLLFGAGQAAADSLPGDPLYGLKLAIEDARLVATGDSLAVAELARAHAGDRLDEVVSLLEEGRPLSGAVLQRAEAHLETALDTALRVQGAERARSLQALESALQERQQRIVLMSDDVSAQTEMSLQKLQRAMERVRERACTGLGNCDDQQGGQHEGAPGMTPHLTHEMEPGRNRDHDGDQHMDQDHDGDQHMGQEHDGDQQMGKEHDGDQHMGQDHDGDQHVDQGHDQEQGHNQDQEHGQDQGMDHGHDDDSQPGEPCDDCGLGSQPPMGGAGSEGGGHRKP